MLLCVKILWDAMAILSLMISEYESAVLTCFIYDGNLFLCRTIRTSVLSKPCGPVWDTKAIFILLLEEHGGFSCIPSLKGNSKISNPVRVVSLTTRIIISLTWIVNTSTLAKSFYVSI